MLDLLLHFLFDLFGLDNGHLCVRIFDLFLDSFQHNAARQLRIRGLVIGGWYRLPYIENLLRLLLFVGVVDQVVVDVVKALNPLVIAVVVDLCDVDAVTHALFLQI